MKAITILLTFILLVLAAEDEKAKYESTHEFYKNLVEQTCNDSDRIDKAETVCNKGKEAFEKSDKDIALMKAHYSCVTKYCKENGAGTNWLAICLSAVGILCILGCIAFAVLKGFKAVDMHTEGGDEDFKKLE